MVHPIAQETTGRHLWCCKCFAEDVGRSAPKFSKIYPVPCMTAEPSFLACRLCCSLLWRQPKARDTMPFKHQILQSLPILR